MDVNADTVNVGGDVVGRDKVEGNTVTLHPIASTGGLVIEQVAGKDQFNQNKVVTVEGAQIALRQAAGGDQVTENDVVVTPTPSSTKTKNSDSQ